MSMIHLPDRGWYDEGALPPLDEEARDFIERGLREVKRVWREKASLRVVSTVSQGEWLTNKSGGDVPRPLNTPQ